MFLFSIILCLKAPVCSVCVCRVYCWCTCVFLLFPALDVLCWILKTHSCYPRLLVPSGSVTWQKTRPKPLTLCVPSVFPRFLFSVFCFGCSLMDPLLRLENLLLLLGQGERSLKGNTRLFLVLVNVSSCPDDALCTFYDRAEDCHRARAADDVIQGVWAVNNARQEGESRGQRERGEELRPLHSGWVWAEYGAGTVPHRGREGSCSRVKPREGYCSRVKPREGYCSRVKPREGSCSRVKPREGSCSRVKPREGSCSRVKPRESPERAPVPELSPERPPVPELSPERPPVPELSPERASVPVFSPERTSVPVFSPERALVPVIRPESPEAHKCPPSHLVLPPPPLPSGSPSACPQPTIYSVRAQWDYHPPVSLWSEYPLTPPTASKLRNPPLPIDPSAPPWLLAPASLPWLICPLAPPGSFILPAPPWSVVDPAVSLYYTPPVAPCLSVPPALSGSSIPSAPPLSLQLHCAIWIPVSALVTASSALPWSPGSYPSPWLIATAKSNSSIQWPRSIYIYIYIYIYTNRRN